MKIKEILEASHHRPWSYPAQPWTYYQEWNKTVFLHWPVDAAILRAYMPEGLKLDLYDGSAWVSHVAFTMQKIRPHYLPAFAPVSDFHEINIRTYVTCDDQAGVYFLSMEGSKELSCRIARAVSGLPYRFSRMDRSDDHYISFNERFEDHFEIQYNIGAPIRDKSEIDKWLSERYILFQDDHRGIHSFDVHHIEWPLFYMEVDKLEISYPRFDDLMSNSPQLMHYSPGVQVLAWGKKMIQIVS